MVFFNHAEFWGGGEANLFETCNVLQNSQYNIWIVGPHGSELQKKCKQSSMNYYEIPFPSFKVKISKFILNLYLYIRDIRTFHKRVKPDILISNSARCNLYATIFYFFYSECIQIWILNEYQISKFHLFIFGWIPRCYIAVSNSIKKYYHKANTYIIRNAFSLPSSFLEIVSISNNTIEPFIIGFFGRFVRLKGIHVLIDSVQLLKNRIPLFKLKLFGNPSEKDPKYFEELKEQVIRNKLTDIVEFVGFRQDVLAAMKECSVIVSPTLSKYGGPESFGRIIIEAMIVGIPVVATNCGGPQEIIKQNNSGLLVSEDDPEALAVAIERIYTNNDLAQMYVKNARASLNNYEASTIAKEYVRVFDSIEYK